MIFRLRLFITTQSLFSLYEFSNDKDTMADFECYCADSAYDFIVQVGTRQKIPENVTEGMVNAAAPRLEVDLGLNRLGNAIMITAGFATAIWIAHTLDEIQV